MMTRIRKADERFARHHPMAYDTVVTVVMLLAALLIAVGLVLLPPPAPVHAATEGTDLVIELPTPVPTPRPATTATFGWVCGGDAFVQLQNDGDAQDLVSIAGDEVTVMPGTILVHTLRATPDGEWALGPLVSITNQVQIPVNVTVDSTGVAHTPPCFALWPDGAPAGQEPGEAQLAFTGNAHTADLIGAGLVLCLFGTLALYARRKLVRR